MEENLMEQSFFLSDSSTLSSCHNSPTTEGLLVFAVVFSKMFKAYCFVCGKLWVFAFLKHHMIQYAKTLKQCFWDQIPWKTHLCYSIISILTLPKNNPTKFCFRCHRLKFISYTYVRTYMKHKFIDSRQYRNVTNYMNITNAYICQLTV